MPRSCACSMIASASAGGVSGPKFMVPRHRRLTERPERPRWMYSMCLTLSRRRRLTRPRPTSAPRQTDRSVRDNCLRVLLSWIHAVCDAVVAGPLGRLHPALTEAVRMDGLFSCSHPDSREDG